jgi:hypothetical protein
VLITCGTTLIDGKHFIWNYDVEAEIYLNCNAVGMQVLHRLELW